MGKCKTLLEAWATYSQYKLPALKGKYTELLRWEKHIEPYLASVPLDNISSLHLTKLRMELEGKSLSPQTGPHCLGLARRVLRKSMLWGLYDGPIPVFEMPKFDNKRQRHLSKEEAFLLLKTLSTSSPRWHDITAFVLNRGLRANEIFFCEFKTLKSTMMSILYMFYIVKIALAGLFL